MFNVASGDLDALPGLLIVRGDAGENDRIFVHDQGHAREVDYALTPTSLTSVNGPYAPSTQPPRTFAGVTFDGTAEALELNCSLGPNQIDLVPSVPTAFTINGNPPGFGDPSGKDYLAVDFRGITGKHLTYSGPPLGNGNWKFSNRAGVAFTSIEKVKYFAIAAIASSAGPIGTQPIVNVYDADTGVPDWALLVCPADPAASVLRRRRCC